MTDVLGKLSCLDIPDFGGENVIYSPGGISSIQMDTASNLPPPGVLGRLYINTNSNKFFRDDGSAWIDLTPAADVVGTLDQITTNLSGATVTLSLSVNPIIPGAQRIKIPAGATADRPLSPVAGDHRFNSEIGAPELFNASDWLPYGKIVQHVTGQVAALSSTSQIPLDSTIPQITEGFQILSTVFTPVSTTSKLIFEAVLIVSNSNNARHIIAALFKDGAVGAVTASVVYSPTASSACNLKIKYIFNSTNKAAKTFALRLGASGSGTSYVGSAGVNTLGGIINNYFTITEII